MHAGNVFAALTAWLVAKSQGGRIVLRIEHSMPSARSPSTSMPCSATSKRWG
ncbi:MAG: hypothetical protein ACLR3C_04725 [Eggerthella lenta]